MQHFPTGARRDDEAGKADWPAFPIEGAERVVAHMTANATKYGRLNYAAGIPVSRCIRSAWRHLVAYTIGKRDEDHLAAAATNLLFALFMQEVHGDNPEINDDPRGLSVQVGHIERAMVAVSNKPPMKCERCGGQWYTFLQCPVCPQQGANDERP